MNVCSNYNLLPTPEIIIKKEGIVTLDITWSITLKKGCASEQKRSALLLQSDVEQITGIRLPIEERTSFANEKTIAIGLKGDDPVFEHLCEKAVSYSRNFNNKEHYALLIEKRIIIAANESSGAFYGTQTLLQLLEQTDNAQINNLLIVDGPKLKIRGVHFYPHYVDMEESIRKMGRYKINTIVVEYGNMFPSEKYPFLSAPNAFQKEKLKELLTLARERYIEVVPLLECLGHTHFIVSHDEFSHIREGNSMLCPSNQASLNLMKELITELVDFHGKGQYFHIGADEAIFLGKCPICQERIAEIGKSKLFTDYINKIAAFVKSIGLIPIMWDDMFRQYPDAISELDKDIIVHYWDYCVGEKKIPCIANKCSEQWMQKHYDKKGKNIVDNGYYWRNLAHEWDYVNLPNEEKETFSKYWTISDSPLYFKSLSYIDFYKNLGLKTIGSPAAICSADPERGADYKMRLSNIDLFAERIIESNELGLITSCWRSIREQGMYALAFSAERSWAGLKTSEEKFDENFSKCHYGFNNKTLIDVLFNICGHITVLNARRFEKQVLYALKLMGKIISKATKNQGELSYIWVSSQIALYESIRVLMMAGPLSYAKKKSMADELEKMADSIKKEIESKNLKICFKSHRKAIKGVLEDND